MVAWNKKYGEMFTVWLPKPIIVLADYKVMKDALIKHGENIS